MSPHRHDRRRTARPNKTALALALAACLAASAPAFAQSTAATLRGHVTGGATVTATNVANGATRSTTAGADGSYTLVGLEPGTYRVESGGASQTIRLTVAATSNLDLAAPSATGPATNLGTVTVTGVALADVKTSEVGRVVDLHQIETTPQLTRNFLEFADTVPGMVFTQDSSGNTSLRGGGQNNSSTNVYIDGVGQKSYVKEGGVSGQFSTAGNPFAQLAIGEYKVITSNYKAEYGQISSAAVTAVTKSGTNEFEGQLFYRYTDRDMRARTLGEIQPGRDKANDSPQKDFGFAVGGPIIKDRMHFFVAYEGKRFDIPDTVVPGVLTSATLPSQVTSLYGPISKPFEEDLWFGKVDWELTDDDRIEVSGQVRDESQTKDIGGTNAPDHGIYAINKDIRWNARWQHSAANWFNEVLYTHEDSRYNPSPITIGNGIIYTYRPGNDATIIQSGGASPLAGQNKGQKGWSIEDNLTFYGLGANDDHTVKMGVRYKSIDLHAEDALDLNPQFYYSVTNTSVAATPWKVFFAKEVSGLGGLSQSADSAAKQFGLYLQDDWEVNDHLLLNLGVRWDYEENPSYLDFVTPANVVAAFDKQDPAAPTGQTYRQTLMNGGIDINDYISTGGNRNAFKGAWQPRLGFSYDIDADERHVIHGGIGRAYDRDLYDYLQLEITKTAFPQFTVYFPDPANGNVCRGNPCVPFNASFLADPANVQALVAAGNGGEIDMLNNDLKAPYSDQFSLGIANRLGQWQTDVTVQRVNSHDGFAFTLGNRYPNGDFYRNGGQPWGNGVPGFGALILGNNGIETRITQLLVSAVKPYSPESHWSASLAYTYTSGEQNRDINEHYSFDGATIGDYPFIDTNAAPRHRFVAAGSYDGWWGINLGAKLTLATSTAVNDFICQPPSSPVGEAFCKPAADMPSGYGRFLIGGGMWAFRSLDLQATKDFTLWGDTSAFVRLDVLNALNFRNRSDIARGTTNGELKSFYNPTGNFTGVPRTVKVEVGFKF